jgi:transposase
MGRPKKAAGQEQRRQFTLEFKQEAVRQLHQDGRSVSDVARSLGIRREMLAQWRRVLAGHAPRLAGAETGPASRQALEQEVRRLKKRVAELEEEQVILGKATAYFAKRHG